MRFDDSLTTVLAADAESGFGAQAAWRQLVDLLGRGRVVDIAEAIERLRALRDQVPASVRAASARAIAGGEPPLALVALFAQDDLAVAAPVLREIMLAPADWLTLLPRLTPGARSLIRQRRDLPPEVARGLASFGATDFVLGHEPAASAPDDTPAAETLSSPAPVAAPLSASAPLSPSGSFVAFGDVARALPVVEEAIRQAAEPPRFEIAELVARIDAFRRDRPDEPAPVEAVVDRFDFHTDAAGIVRWVEGVARTPLVGVSLTGPPRQGAVTLDSAVAVAVRARASFRDVRLDVAGESSATGTWRLSGVPRFDPSTGGFTGVAGTGRRPRTEEPAVPGASPADSLRQLVHELRTPANAVAGFAELIGTELLGPVPPVYRERAQLIQSEAAALIAAVDDLDTAARLEGQALDLRPTTVDLAAMLDDAVTSLQPLAVQRRAALVIEPGASSLVLADERMLARLIDRLLSAVLATAEPGERLQVQLVRKTRTVRVHLTRPRSLTVGTEDALLAGAPGGQGAAEPLLGIGFTVRLVRDLAVALGGSLAIVPDRLTLRLPTVVIA